jgi:hypothetical protein
VLEESGEMGRWGDWEMGRWGDGEIGRLGDWEIGRGGMEEEFGIRNAGMQEGEIGDL